MPRRPHRIIVGSALVVALLGSSCGRGPRTDVKATAWESAATAAFGPLTSALPVLDGSIRRWRAGELDAGGLRDAAAKAIAATADSRNRVTGLPPSPGGRMVDALYRLSVLLDLQAANVAASIGDLSADGADGQQIALLAVRLRVLGDRVFDRGRALLPPSLVQVDPGLEVHLPEEVPNWVTEGLAAGPPLDPAGPPGPPPAEASSQLRQDTRPSESLARWLADVRSAQIPAASAVGRALTTGGEPDAALAASLGAAAEQLRSRPDPAGDREMGARLRLSLLVDAEAVLAARGATGVGPDGRTPLLHEVALRLALISDALWPAAAGPRSNGLAPGLLDDDQ